MIHIIFQAQLSGFLPESHHSCRAVHIPVFQKPGMRCPVRIYQSVHTEIAVMDLFPKISSVKILFFSISSLSPVHSMITPLPHKASAKLVILINHLEIILQISRSVSHSMTVFDQKKGLIRFLFHIFLDFFQRRIHSAENINIAVIVFSFIIPVKRAFIAGQPCFIKLLRPL